MIVVLVYGGLWLLTIKWGANQLAHELAANFSQELEEVEVIWRNDRQVEIQGRPTIKSPKGAQPSRLLIKQIISITSWCPFLLRSERKVLIDHGYGSGEDVGYFLWFFGLRLDIG